MRYSREYLDQRSASTGFRPDTLEKVLRLLRLLDQVARHPFLGSRLLLKGGTALNLFYAAAPRLSVDLDFNYVGAVDRAEMLRERPEIERAVTQVVAGEGYRVQWGRDEHAGQKLYLTYVSALGSQDRIELDLNCLGEARGSVLLTPNERRVAEDRRDCYWLYVVTDCRTTPRLQEPIKHPARLPWHEVQPGADRDGPRRAEAETLPSM